MPALTDEDYVFYKQALKADLGARAEMKALAPTKQAWKDSLQALEDGYEARRVAIKAEMDTALGQTMTNALAQKLEKVWMQKKVKGL